MIDLASFFAEAATDVAADGIGEFPGFPVSRMGERERQATEDKDISRISRISRDKIGDLVSEIKNDVQARARAGAGVRARDPIENRREIREQREMPAGPEPYSSRSLSQKREIERETGNPAPLPATDGLPLWRAGIAALDPERPPCPGYRAGEWPRTLGRILAFLDEFGDQAAALNWTASRLFGVHPVAGVVRVDACGGLVLPTAGNVRAITATTISLGHLTHRTLPGQTKGAPIWSFGRSETTPCEGVSE